jgi:glutaredoxin 3
MARVKVYTTRFCGYCTAAKGLLAKRGIDYEEVDVSSADEVRRWLLDVTGARTVPQIFIDDAPVGGYQELAKLDRSGELQNLLAACASDQIS